MTVLLSLKVESQPQAFGFAVGFERIMLALEALGVAAEPAAPSCVYVACAGAEQAPVVFDAVLALREAGIRCEADRTGRSLKAQFKQADKMGATLCVVIGQMRLKLVR